MSKRPLYSYVVPPQYRFQSPDALLSEQEYDLLRITVEDFLFVTREVTDDLAEVAADRLRVLLDLGEFPPHRRSDQPGL